MYRQKIPDQATPSMRGSRKVCQQRGSNFDKVSYVVFFVFAFRWRVDDGQTLKLTW